MNTSFGVRLIINIQNKILARCITGENVSPSDVEVFNAGNNILQSMSKHLSYEDQCLIGGIDILDTSVN